MTSESAPVALSPGPEAVELRFNRLSDAARLPSRANDGDAGLDLRSIEPAHIGPGERWAIGTGLAVEIPDGHAGLVLPRSGLAMRHGITAANSPGLIDSGYRGEIKVILINHDPAETFTVEPGDRIAQLVLVAVAPAEPVAVETLEDSERGRDGFGSSGVA